MITLRPTTETDIDAVSQVLAASYSTLLAADYPAQALSIIVPLISRAKIELVSSGTYFAAEKNGQILAVGGWTKTRPGTNETLEGLGHIRHVATHPEHVRKGAAGLIMTRCLSDARATGMTAMECLSTRTAMPFYSKFGFAVVVERDVLVAGMPFASVEMKKAF